MRFVSFEPGFRYSVHIVPSLSLQHVASTSVDEKSLLLPSDRKPLGSRTRVNWAFRGIPTVVLAYQCLAASQVVNVGSWCCSKGGVVGNQIQCEMFFLEKASKKEKR